MSHKLLDDHLRGYYDSQELDPMVLERLRRLADLERGGSDSSPSGSRRALHRRILSRVAPAAAALAAAALLVLALPGLHNGETETSEALTSAILREIALNHNKNLTVEFPATGYPRLREQMDKLDFSLRPPLRTAAGDPLRMLGGRYCSIQGRLAAQIKLEDEHGHVWTLYQTSFDENFEGLPELQRAQDGVGIRVWRENDLLFGLAGSEI